ncbi:MAG: hypothetical protein HY836_07585 [Aquabacterium sp.]|uniref:hypothetical protein n=1 Tax=Aquabacterium sp. TaxID=1872578 RepID=UPI0025C5DA28|nr:hypothetical protein [Aquabacterium sp.]MBI5925449.1 hypothetical protein [Aquabacterium sp.]
MAIGKFRLYYVHEHVKYPCVGVQYRLVNQESGRFFSHGITDANGETKPVESVHASASCTLEILNANTGTYEAPDLDGDIGASSRPTLKIGASKDSTSTTESVRIKPYLMVYFHTQQGNKPIKGAKFTAYLTDANGKEAVARDLDRNAPITGVTDAQGRTGIIFCAAPLVFKFEMPGTPVKVASKRLQPLIKGQHIVRYDMPFKTVSAHTVPQKDDALARLAGKVSLPILISPADDELIAVPQSAFDEFEQVSGLLEQIMANGHRAKLDLSRALESGNAKEIEAAEKALKISEDKIKSELNKNFSKQTDLKEVVTFESTAKGVNAQGGKQMGMRRRYLSNDRYLALKNGRINKNEYKLNIKFSQGSATGGASVSPKTLDVKALKDAFQQVKTELKSKQNLAKPDPVVLTLLDEAATQFSDTIVKSETYEVEAHAQWLRLVAGAGASTTLDWKAKKAEIQGNLQAKVVLCEGKAAAKYAFPSLKGWMMKLGDDELGAIRAVVSCELYGFAGAKVIASGTAGVSLQGLKQVVVGINKDPHTKPLAGQVDAKRRLPVFDPVSAYEKMPDDLNGVKAEIDAFAGVEGGITPGGQLQWQPPTEKEFVSFAEVSASVAATAGGGFNGKVYVFLAGGKFRVRLAAGLCLGVGAKGALEFTVNAEKLFQFVKWVHYQLLNSGVRQLVYITREAFMALSQLLLLLIQEGISVLDGKTAAQARQTEAYRQIEATCATVDQGFQFWLAQIDQAKTRNQLVQNVNRKPQWLVHAPPETRGMLLYQITRHDLTSHMRDVPSVSFDGVDAQVHFMETHKEAIINIMATATTARTWENVMEHMTADGDKSSRPAGKNEGDVIRFLNNGYSLVQDLPSLMQAMNQRKEVKESGNKHLDAYLKMRNKVRNDFPKGYTVARLDSSHLDIILPNDGREHPDFAGVQTVGIGEAYAGDPGSSLV